MLKTTRLLSPLALLCFSLLIFFSGCSSKVAKRSAAAGVYPIEEGYVEGKGVLLFYRSIGEGVPLLVLHGGPGASHNYFLPHLLPLARHNRLVFIDERGSGRSERLQNPEGYTIDAMVEDVEAVRKNLHLESVNLLGHSYGGALAQAYALKYQHNLRSLILCSTWHSTRKMNAVFDRMKERMSPGLRNRINTLEAAGLFGHGKPYEQNRYTNEYMVAAWGEGYFPYIYRHRPDPNHDPAADGNMSWDLYRTMWGSHGEFIIDGNLKSVEYEDRLSSIVVPTLITVGDNDECDPSLSREMQGKIRGAKLVILPTSGHMTFVDQPELFIATVDEFINPAPRYYAISGEP